MKLFNTEIDFKSIFKRGIKKKYEPFGCFLITGYMGSGKTYFAVKFALQFKDTYKIRTNIKSLRIPNANIEYFDRVEELYNDTDQFVLYIIDELGKKYTKEARADKDFYNFLQHSRKLKKIVLIIHQEYLQVPIWLRGVCETVFTTHKILFLPLFITYRGFATLDPNTLEWTVQPNYRYIYKRNKSVASLYDTHEVVATL